jgi:hypothetical protein
MEKWFFITIAMFLVSMGVSLAVESYSIGQCRETAIKAGMSVADIARICR